MRLEHLGDLVADPHQRIERRHRLLENHRDPAAAHVLHVAFGEAEKVAPFEQDSPASGCTCVAASPSARERSSTCRSPIHRRRRRSRPASGRSETPRRHKAGRHRRAARSSGPDRDSGAGGHDQRPSFARRGLSASLRPSPTRLSASTVRRIASPGNNVIHQASDHGAAGTDHVAPGHQVRVAEPEEGQGRFEQDRGRDHQRGQHDDRAKARWAESRGR